MRNTLIILSVLAGLQGCGQKKTDASLFMKSDNIEYQHEISSKSGDLFNTIGHHGPAVENQWLGFRIYFDKRVAIDLYSKSKPGLELKDAGWYPTKEQQQDGWGADYYKVGETVGLGGIRLWDGKEVLMLNPVTNRTARVFPGADSSYMEMLSEGVPYNGKLLDVLLRVTVYNDTREAKVEAISLSGDEIQFVTGLNYHKDARLLEDHGFIATWGIHPEDVAAEIVTIGAALVFNPSDFTDKIDDGSQYLLVSKPAKSIQTSISACSSREPVLNTKEGFLDYVKMLASEVHK